MVRIEDASGWPGEAETLFTPGSEEELIAIFRDAFASRTPITLIGGGTGVTGGSVPAGGIAVSLARFAGIRIEPGRATVGAGATLKDLQKAAAASGQFYAPDPTEWMASIGGTIANNASGSRSFFYGDTRAHVLALRAVFPDGSARTFRRGEAIDFEAPRLPLPRTTKHSAGYRLGPGMDWVDLFIGSEGTLAAVVEAELRLLPAAGETLTGVIFFERDEQALDAVDAWRAASGLRMLEYMDAESLGLLRGRYPEIPREARACLTIEHEGAAEPDWDEWASRLEQSGAQAEASWFAASQADRERFRAFRHALPEEVNAAVRRSGFQKAGSDYAVPADRNREMLDIYREALEREFPRQYAIFGHIGDAHLHVNILPADASQDARARALLVEFARAAVALGGTVGAEHGLGKRKARLLELQYTSQEIESMKAVKRRFDPHWLLGRGNLFDE